MVFGDLLMRCLYRTRPYEREKGSANALYEKWNKICIDNITGKKGHMSYHKICEKIVEEFDNLPLIEGLTKPRVGIVGEILVKYMPLANNHLVEVLESEGAEAVVPDMLDFFAYCVYNSEYKHKYLGFGKKSKLISKIGVNFIELIRSPAKAALKKSKRFGEPVRVDKIANKT